MTGRDLLADSPDSAQRNVNRFGQVVSLLMALTAAAALAIAITMAPARSGPNCSAMVEMGAIEACVTYPYTDVAAYVPTEYIWMYPAVLLPFLLLALVAILRQRDPAGYGIVGQLALSMAAITAAVHCINYYIQLAVVQPSLVKGELDSLILWSQYNPHGIFIALENLGYFFMGVVFLLLALMLTRRNRLEMAIRYILLIAAIVVIGAMFAMSIIYGADLEYIYEVLSLLVDWLVIIVAGLLLFFNFRRAPTA